MNRRISQSGSQTEAQANEGEIPDTLTEASRPPARYRISVKGKCPSDLSERISKLQAKAILIGGDD